MMTDREIRQKAYRRMADKSVSCVSLMVFVLAVLSFLLLCEMIAYLFMKETDYRYLYDVRKLFSNRQTTMFWCVKTGVELILVMPISHLMRRQFLDVANGNSPEETRQYITAHASTYYRRAFAATLVHTFIKLSAALPLVCSLYGVYYWSYVTRINELTSRGLFALTVCVGFSAVWAGLLVHYYISLALTSYIISLDPHCNIFEACDLSIKFMEGNHMRYIRFKLFFLLFLPAAVFVYPVFAIFPYYKISCSMFAQELMGESIHDRLPGMVKRWRKYRKKK
ncbi:MAG: hypothetical protein IJ129_04710 [Ruminococcus sp.]|nr:hypothetical protein [Ruminococcus sp.]